MTKEEQLMSGFWDIFNKKMWLDGIKLKAALDGYNPSEIHCIEYVGEHADSNVTELAESFYMTKSAISKLTKRLIKKGLIESYQKPDNRKEIYFRLTEEGKSVNEIHKKLDDEFQARDSAVFDQVTNEQYQMMTRFTELYNRHLDMEIAKQESGTDSYKPDYL